MGIKINKKTYLHSKGWDPIKEFVSPLFYKTEEDYKCIGTLVIIRPNLAITAKHVILEYMRDNGICATSGTYNSKYDLLTYQYSSDGRSVASWYVVNCFLSNMTDIAYLKLAPGNKAAADIINNSLNETRVMKIDLNPPVVGTKIYGFGYPNSIVKENQLHIFPHTTGGKVVEIHMEKRDETFVNYPVFRWDARTDHGMSGGPVFNGDGSLIGIISTGYETENHKKDFSYIALLWPSMCTKIIFDRMDYPNLNGQKYPIIELARDNHLLIKGWKNINIVQNGDGTETISFEKTKD